MRLINRVVKQSTTALTHRFNRLVSLQSTHCLNQQLRKMALSSRSGSRAETDAFGPIDVENKYYWGAQTQRSLQNFRIGHNSHERMPIEVVYALAQVKRAAAVVNAKHFGLEQKHADAIVQAADEILSGKLDEHFPLVVWYGQ